MKRQPHNRAPALVLASLLLLTLVPMVAAQETAAEDTSDARPKKTVIKLTRFLDVREAANLLRYLDVEVAVEPERSALVIHSRDGAALETALKLIDELDEPPVASRNIELTVFILGGSKEPAASKGIAPDLEAAVRQLEQLFGYRTFTLLETVFLRLRHSSTGTIEGVFPWNGGGKPKTYTLHVAKAQVIPREEKSIVRLDGLRFKFGHNATLGTDVEVREGQKVVVGKATPDGGEESMILVLEAKILE